MASIIVTGTPGTGKTTLAKKIAAKLKYKYIDVAKLVKENKLEEKYDKKRKCSVVDVKTLSNFLIKNVIKKGKNVVIDSHMSHYLSPKYVDLCIVTKCNLKTLKKRLEKKGYDADKVKENLECEIFDVCLTEAKEKGHKVKVVDTSGKASFLKEKFLKALK